MCAVLAAAAAHLSHRAADDYTLPAPEDPREVYASLDALRLLSVGYKNLVADLYWLRAIADYGSNRSHALLYPNLESLLRRTLGLDPYFADAYLFAGNALTTNEMDPRPALELLEQGMAHRPDDWRIAFLYGFVAYHYLAEDARAADALEKAAALPGAPPYLKALAVRVASAGRDPEVALLMLDRYLETSGVRDAETEADAEQRAMYLAIRDALVLEVGLRRLERAAAIFVRRHGRPPHDVEELVAPGLLPALPPDPFGGRFTVDDEGRVGTTSESFRLQDLDRVSYLERLRARSPDE